MDTQRYIVPRVVREDGQRQLRRACFLAGPIEPFRSVVSKVTSGIERFAIDRHSAARALTNASESAHDKHLITARSRLTDSGGCVVQASREAGFSCRHILPNLQRTVAVMNDASERRAAQRFEIFAQANVLSADDVYVMSVRNISGAGAFLEGLPEEHADLAPGIEIEVAISATAPGMGDDDVLNIDCRGRVVRVEPRSANSPGGFGISLEPKTAEDQERLGDLLDRLIDLPLDQRPSSLG